MGIFINSEAQNIFFWSGICFNILVMLDVAGWLTVIWIYPGVYGWFFEAALFVFI